MIKHTKYLISLFAFLLAIGLTACGNNKSENTTDQNNYVSTNDETANGTLLDNSSSNNEAPKHDYIEGYEQLLSYVRINEIEQCTSPDDLCSLLSNLYDEEIAFVEMKYEEIKNDFFIQKLALYDVAKAQAPITSDVYAFFLPYNESPIFIMDNEGSYPVGNYEMKEINGSLYNWVSVWSSTDLFLCLHSFAGCEGDSEQRGFLVETVKSMDWYIDYEARILINHFGNENKGEIFKQIASSDSGVELLYPIMDGTIRAIIDDMLKKARDICSVEGPIYNYEELYPYQDAIIEYLNAISGLEKTNDYNDWLLDSVFDDMSWMGLYVEDFITFASQGFTDPRIEDYTAKCYNLTDPIEAAKVFLLLK